MNMVIYLCLIMSVCFLAYGALIVSGLVTPLRSKIMVDIENRKQWCKAEGVIRLLWGLDMALLAMYLHGSFLPTVCLICFVCLTLYIIAITYKNNLKYMK